MAVAAAPAGLERKVLVTGFKEKEIDVGTGFSPRPVSRLVLTLEKGQDVPSYLSPLELPLQLPSVTELRNELKEGKKATFSLRVTHLPADGSWFKRWHSPLRYLSERDKIAAEIAVESGGTYALTLGYCPSVSKELIFVNISTMPRGD